VLAYMPCNPSSHTRHTSAEQNLSLSTESFNEPTATYHMRAYDVALERPFTAEDDTAIACEIKIAWADLVDASHIFLLLVSAAAGK